MSEFFVNQVIRDTSIPGSADMRVVAITGTHVIAQQIDPVTGLSFGNCPDISHNRKDIKSLIPVVDPALTRFFDVLLGDTALEDVATQFTCTEAEAIAGLLRAHGNFSSADSFLQSHAAGDDDYDMHGPEWHDPREDHTLTP